MTTEPKFIPNEAAQITLNDNITAIGNNAFAGGLASNTGGIEITGGETGMHIQLNALPAALQTLGVMAFRYAGEGVTFTSIPNGVAIIENQTFTGCTGLKIAQLGGDDSALTTIDTFAFYNCNQEVPVLTIGSSITELKVRGTDGALSNAYNSSTLQSVFSYSTNYPTPESLQAVGLTWSGKFNDEKIQPIEFHYIAE